jgi:hypothetical protein
MIEIRQTEVYADWFASLRDRQARARIDVRIRRLSLGNPGDVRPVGSGVSELRIDYGPLSGLLPPTRRDTGDLVGRWRQADARPGYSDRLGTRTRCIGEKHGTGKDYNPCLGCGRASRN